MKRIAASCALLSLSWLLQAKEAKLKPEELIEKHLAAIGTPEARAEVKSRMMNGTAEVVFRVGSFGQLSGGSTFASQGNRVRLALKFPHPEYPGEQLAFDGEDVSVGVIHSGRRSELSQFVHEYDALLKEGLMGGVTSTAWCLLDVKTRQPRMAYNGLKKFEGRELHELRYRPRKGLGDFVITLYFEPDTFRHVYTTYVLKIASYMGATPEESARQRDVFYRMREEFGDFRTVDGLTLPHSYKLALTYEGQNQTRLTQWTAAFGEVRHNPELDPSIFAVR